MTEADKAKKVSKLIFGEQDWHRGHVSKKDCVVIGYGNDYPDQHGDGESYIIPNKLMDYILNCEPKEMVECECGHTVPLEFSVSDTEDGNATCMPCIIEELKTEWKSKDGETFSESIEECKSLILKLLPQEEFGESYEAEALWNILEELSTIK